MRRDDEISDIKPKSLCVEVCTIFKKNSKSVKENFRGIRT
jgi:hypothetical protein